MSKKYNISTTEILSEIIIGYVFWSLFEGLAPMIWFYPLNSLEISGYEVFAVAFCSPILYVWPLKPIIQNRWCVALLRIGSLIGLGSFQAPTTLQRLIILACGVACVMLVLCASLWHPLPKQRNLTFWGLMLGKFALLSSRIWFRSFIPTWWNNTTNTVVITLASIATLNKIISGHDAIPANTETTITTEKVGKSSKKKETTEEKMHKPITVFTGLGAASLFYISYAIFGEVSLVTRWTVKGFPEPGPAPYPWGVPILLALWFGISLSPCRHVTYSVIWWLIAAISFMAMYLLETWAAYIGGVILAAYIMSIWPEMVDRMTSCSPAITLLMSSLFCVISILFGVWTVAYNFVPGGIYTREHTGWLIGYLMVTLALALFTKKKNVSDSSHTAFIETNTGKMPNSSTSFIIFLIVLAGLGGFIYRYPDQEISHPQIQHPKADFTAAIWTYHFGYDNEGWPSLERTAEFLNNTGADVITLLESDASKPFLGNNDLGMWLGERLKMHVDFGVSTRDHTWGNLLLSKYPIVKSRPLLLPSPHGELAPAIAATINMTGNLVDFVVTHMGNDRDRLDRKLQSETLAEELKTAENPVVFLGYVTSAPGSAEYKKLLNAGNVKDIDDSDQERWCEYIMYNGLQKLGYARVSHAGLSDTELQMARFRIPENLNSYKDNHKVETDPSEVKEEFRFNPLFGEYLKGHNWRKMHEFHMSTPKYFVP